METDYKVFLYSIKARTFLVFAFILEISNCGNENDVFSNEYFVLMMNYLFIEKRCRVNQYPAAH